MCIYILVIIQIDKAVVLCPVSVCSSSSRVVECLCSLISHFTGTSYVKCVLFILKVISYKWYQYFRFQPRYEKRECSIVKCVVQVVAEY